MNLTNEIYTRVEALTGETDPQQCLILHTLSAGANGTIAAAVRPDLDVLNCRETLVTAGCMYVLAAYLEMDEAHHVERFTVGDVTIHQSNTAAGAKTLRKQADRMLAPYHGDRFSFRGV